MTVCGVPDRAAWREKQRLSDEWIKTVPKTDYAADSPRGKAGKAAMIPPGELVADVNCDLGCTGAERGEGKTKVFARPCSRIPRVRSVELRKRYQLSSGFKCLSSGSFTAAGFWAGTGAWCVA